MRLATPVIVSITLQTLYQLVNAFWLGRLGAVPVAVVSVTTPLTVLLLDDRQWPVDRRGDPRRAVQRRAQSHHGQSRRRPDDPHGRRPFARPERRGYRVGSACAAGARSRARCARGRGHLSGDLVWRTDRLLRVRDVPVDPAGHGRGALPADRRRRQRGAQCHPGSDSHLRLGSRAGAGCRGRRLGHRCLASGRRGLGSHSAVHGTLRHPAAQRGFQD